MKKYAVLVLIMFCFGCTASSRKQIVTISLTNSGRSLKIKGINNDILQEINRDSVNTWQSLIPVYKLPADTDMKDYQRPQPGKYTIVNNTILFTPDTPFAKPQSYFVRWFHYDEGKMPVDYIKSNKKLGRIDYTDIDFKR